MKEKIFVSLSGRNQAWFDKKSKKEQSEYLKAHPNSKFGSKSKTPAKKSAAKPVTKKMAKAVTKKAAPKTTKKAAPKKKRVQRKDVVVHKDTDKMHGEALKQKKAMIDKLVAPYARELGKLRLKRDSGKDFTNNDAKRYKQLLATIAELHRGR